MEIREIWSNPVAQFDVTVNKMMETQENKEAKEVKDTKNTSTAENSQSLTAWQKDILLQAMDKLENNVQVNNNHPLGKANYEPIESFDEALIELGFIKSPFFKQYASEAQANLTAEQVMPIFAAE